MKLNEPFLTKQRSVKNTDLLSIKLLCLKDLGVDRLLLYPTYCFCQNVQTAAGEPQNQESCFLVFSAL